MNAYLFAAADAANNTDGGDAFFGFLIIAGLIWLVYCACSKDPPSYDVKGSITPKK